ncbi:nitrite reductase large subunit NirB [Varunaivibrio sulfuroxidans]|nr:nitrite reductase large subunit NirB [Varunaivibrio sulfuroxidans]WES30801.1 nitrite reductase large subunit NirB [Varunaivibrio sulfuroxidans]
MTRKKLVVIGNGMAGMRTVEEILDRDAEKFAVTVFGAEPRENYNRIMLSPVLSGEKNYEDIVINDQQWYAQNAITLYSGEDVIAIDRQAHCVKTSAGRTMPYDALIIATGSSPFMIKVPGTDLDGVTTFRDMDDVERMADAARSHQNAVVIGGGLLGLEAAYGLRQRGMEVTVLHLMDTLMERQLDEAGGYLLRRELENRGIRVITQADTAALIGKSRVEAVRLKDGREIPADLVVMAVGIVPNAALARDCGLTVERGIVVDDHMTTSDPDVFAVGECVQHRGQTYGLVAPLYEMGKALADRLCRGDEPGDAGPGYQGSVTSTKLKVSGVDLFSAGDFNGGDACEDIVLRDAARGVYKRIVLKDGKIAGAVLYGDAGDGSWYFQMLKEGADVSEIRDTLIFGPEFSAGENADPNAAVAALGMDAEICGCNGVSKGDIVGAIIEHGLESVEDVRAKTKASGSCGSCAGLVESLLAHTLGDAFVAGPALKPICPCTTHTHDDVRHLIRLHNLKSIPAVMQALEWKSPNGCAACRPALNYYLLCDWPGEYTDDNQSRFVNERLHANIQKDGTYSVVPRMWGGVTTAKELRAIADVVDKFAIPSVKLTGGQRIDLFGIPKEQLPAIWTDLNKAGMVSGHAYGKALRTVKTCVGNTWCRFGTQDAMDLGIQLEKLSWGSWTPHKFKMAVSGCPRNCAEATIKDFAVISVDSGFELYVGGNGGITVRVTDLLCKVATSDDVLEYCAAFMQLYREQARYLERTAPWIERVGIGYVKAEIVDDEAGRKALAERFLRSQKIAQNDPWAQHAGADTPEFQPLKLVG